MGIMIFVSLRKKYFFQERKLWLYKFIPHFNFLIINNTFTKNPVFFISSSHINLSSQIMQLYPARKNLNISVKISFQCNTLRINELNQRNKKQYNSWNIPTDLTALNAPNASRNCDHPLFFSWSRTLNVFLSL